MRIKPLSFASNSHHEFWIVAAEKNNKAADSFENCYQALSSRSSGKMFGHAPLNDTLLRLRRAMMALSSLDRIVKTYQP